LTESGGREIEGSGKESGGGKRIARERERTKKERKG
jgi:hypothetical protein